MVLERSFQGSSDGFRALYESILYGDFKGVTEVSNYFKPFQGVSVNFRRFLRPSGGVP